jgi:hypothetical protein
VNTRSGARSAGWCGCPSMTDAGAPTGSTARGQGVKCRFDDVVPVTHAYARALDTRAKRTS